MNRNQKKAIQAFTLVAALGCLNMASAQEMPSRQPGLWKQSHYEGNTTQKPDVVYQCVDAASEEKFRAMAKKMSEQNSCTDNSSKKGNTVVGTSVCEIMGSKVTSEYVISGNMKTEYRVETRTTHEPPLFGQAKSESVILAEWQGPCKPGQKPGDMIFEEDGETQTISQENMSNMQEMSELLQGQDLNQIMQQLQQMQPQGAGGAADMQELNKMLEQLQQLQQR